MSRELMTLMKYHTEAGSERRWKPYNGGTAGAWSNGGYYAVGLLYHSLFRKNLKWTQVPRSSLLREAIAEGRLSVAMRKLWEAGSRPRSAVQETCCRGCCLWVRLPDRCQAQWLYGTDMENRAEVTVKEHYATSAKIFSHPETTVDNQ